MSNPFDKVSVKLTNEELQERIENPAIFENDAVVSAGNELLRRGENPELGKQINKFKLHSEELIKQEQEQIAQEQKQIEDFESQLNGKLVSFWDRLLAHVIESLIIFGLSYVFQIAVMAIVSNRTGADSVVITFPIFLYPIIYYLLFEILGLQATPGKLFLKLKVVNGNGGRVNIFRLAFRYILKYFLSFIFGLNFLSIFSDIKKRAWHDRLSKVYVIKRKNENIDVTSNILDFDIVHEEKDDSDA